MTKFYDINIKFIRYVGRKVNWYTNEINNILFTSGWNSRFRGPKKSPPCTPTPLYNKYADLSRMYFKNTKNNKFKIKLIHFKIMYIKCS